MTVEIFIGRRLPRAWFKRTASKLGGLITFQENLWIIIKQSMSKAKRAANADGRISFVMTSETEPEDINYQIEWIKIRIEGSKENEQEEYEDALQFYKPLKKLFKSDLGKDESLKKHFKTKVLTTEKLQEAYKAGYGSVGDNNLSNKMLEMGIITSINWIHDYQDRDNYPNIK